MGFVVLILLGFESLIGNGELEQVEPDPKDGFEESFRRCIWPRRGSEYCLMAQISLQYSQGR